MNYHVQTLKTTAFIDITLQTVLNVHCTMNKRHDTRIGAQVARVPQGDLRSLAADKGYDWIALPRAPSRRRRPTTDQPSTVQPVNHVHNARINSALYGQRSMYGTVFSTIKRTLGTSELVLMCVVHTIKRAVTQ